MRAKIYNTGFTLVEMIVVIVITGILGGIIALFIRGPVQGYVDSARRAAMNDIADTAMSRITRDLRTALPNSVRITSIGSVYYLEFIPTTGGGRYRAASDVAATLFPCGGSSPASAVLDIAVADTCFEVLGPMPTFPVNDWVVVNNVSSVNVYPGTDRAQIVSAVSPAVSIASFSFPSASPGNRFQVISTPVTYVCSPVAGGVGGTLTRYWGYAIQAAQPTALATLTSVNPGALLAGNVSSCSFSLPQGNNLLAMQLTITESGESISLYDEAYVSNKP